MGNLVYQKMPPHSIDRIIHELKWQVEKLTEKNRKLRGAARKNIVGYIKDHDDEFIDSTRELHIGDIVEIVCTVEDYIEGYSWPYTLNKKYRAIVIRSNDRWCSQYAELLFINYHRQQRYSSTDYELKESIDLCSAELEAGTIKVRILYKADQSDIELEG